MKWFEVDFNNTPYLGCIVEYKSEVPALDEEVMLYTMDDDPPFGFPARVMGITTHKTSWHISFDDIDWERRWEFLPCS